MHHDRLKNRAHTAHDLASRLPARALPGLRAVVAIPVCDEEERIGACIDALCDQRTLTGAPLPPEVFAIVLIFNNCADQSLCTARERLAGSGIAALLADIALPPLQANAGFARGVALDVAALWLERATGAGALLTTDADSRVPPDWIARSLAALDAGCGAVAGRIMLQPDEQARLPETLRHRQAVEADYEQALLHLAAHIDPQPHDPWPNHQNASGASYGVTLSAYRAIGGLPEAACGEDRALARALRLRDIPIRHDPDLVVTTSARLEGRAIGGAADTMRRLSTEPDGTADLMLEAVQSAVRRMVWRRRLRMWHAAGTLAAHDWRDALRLPPEAGLRAAPFGTFWNDVEALSPRLAPMPLRPSRMPAHTGAARAMVRALQSPPMARETFTRVAGDPGDSAVSACASGGR